MLFFSDFWLVFYKVGVRSATLKKKLYSSARRTCPCSETTSSPSFRGKETYSMCKKTCPFISERLAKQELCSGLGLHRISGLFYIWLDIRPIQYPVQPLAGPLLFGPFKKYESTILFPIYLPFKILPGCFLTR